MAKTQATPGPWRVHDRRRVYSDDGMVADCGIQWADDNDEEGAERDWYRAEANAHLIAAAPQMREALEALLPFVARHGIIDCHGDKCRQANCSACFSEPLDSYEALANACAALRAATGETEKESS